MNMPRNQPVAGFLFDCEHDKIVKFGLLHGIFVPNPLTKPFPVSIIKA